LLTNLEEEEEEEEEERTCWIVWSAARIEERNEEEGIE